MFLSNLQFPNKMILLVLYFMLFTCLISPAVLVCSNKQLFCLVSACKVYCSLSLQRPKHAWLTRQLWEEKFEYSL